MFDYGKSASTALKLLSRFGRKYDLQRISKAFDPVESEDSDPTKVTQSVTLAVIPFNSSDQSRMDDSLKEALTLGKLRKAICAAKGLKYAIEPGDVFPALQGEIYIVRGVSPLNVAEVPIIYTIISEKGSLSDLDKTAVEET